MNREILFRGKRVDNGEWAEGAYFPDKDGVSLICTSIVAGTPVDEAGMCIAWTVDPDTVGQYTGLIDKNGKKVFEGDVMEFYVFGSHYKGVVSFVDGNFRVICNHPDASPFLDVVVKRYGAYVTNINDNSELRPCPKCKGTPEYRRVGDMKQYWAVICPICGYCEAKNSEARSTKWGAKRIWNRRAGEDV